VDGPLWWSDEAVTVRGRGELAVWLLASALALGGLFYRLGQLPPGLFVDEVAGGYDASALLRSGRDQYGSRWPMFFRSLDDYKSPLHVYAMVPSQALLGPTALAVRLPCALCAIGMAVAMFFLVRRLTERPALARWMALLALVAPTLFTYARHAVSEASMLPLALVLALLALVRFGDAPSSRSALLAGLAVGLVAYTYTTARLLAPLMVALAALAWLHDPRARPKLPWLVAGALAALAPIGLFLHLHPGTLDRRFHSLWVFWDHPSTWTALRRILSHYREHMLSFNFLFRTGDPNLRHNVGRGLLPVWLLVPLGLGLVALWRRRREGSARFLLGLGVLSGLPVALCDFELPHATRMLHLVPLAFVVASLGISDWLQQAGRGRALLALGLAAVLIEEGSFGKTYFVDYPTHAQAWFDDAMDQTLQIAFAARPPGAALRLPDDFFQRDGIYVKFWGQLDPAAVREHGLDGLGIRELDAPYGPEAVIVVPGDSKREFAGAQRVAEARLFDHPAARWVVLRAGAEQEP